MGLQEGWYTIWHLWKFSWWISVYTCYLRWPNLLLHCVRQHIFTEIQKTVNLKWITLYCCIFSLFLFSPHITERNYHHRHSPTLVNVSDIHTSPVYLLYLVLPISKWDGGEVPTKVDLQMSTVLETYYVVMMMMMMMIVVVIVIMIMTITMTTTPITIIIINHGVTNRTKHITWMEIKHNQQYTSPRLFGHQTTCQEVNNTNIFWHYLRSVFNRTMTVLWHMWFLHLTRQPTFSTALDDLGCCQIILIHVPNDGTLELPLV